jgi:hypothetical protein
MLEGVLGIGWRPTSEDQLGARQPRERVIDLMLRHLGDRADQLVRKRTPKRRSDLRHLARRG